MDSSSLSLIAERVLKELNRKFGEYGQKRLVELLILEANTYQISLELGVPKCAVSFFRAQLPMLLRLTQPKKAELRLVHFKAA